MANWVLEPWYGAHWWYSWSRQLWVGRERLQFLEPEDLQGSKTFENHLQHQRSKTSDGCSTFCYPFVDRHFDYSWILLYGVCYWWPLDNGGRTQEAVCFYLNRYGTSRWYSMWSGCMPRRILLRKDERESKLGSDQLWQPILCFPPSVPVRNPWGMEWYPEYFPEVPLLLHVLFLYPTGIYWSLFLTQPNIGSY